MSPLPSGQPAPLRWIAAPAGRSTPAAWLRQAQSAGFQVIVSTWQSWAADLPGLAAWAQQVRAARAVSAIAVPVQSALTLPLRELDAVGPLLLVLVPDGPSDAAAWPQVRASLAASRWAKLRWAPLGVALCHLGAWRPDVLLAPTASRSQPDVCGTCGARAQCPGPRQDQDVIPFPEAVSNQFDLSESTPNDALVHVEADQLRHFALVQPHTPEVDEALARGQLYLDRSEKARLDDFAADLALLLPTPSGTWRLADAAPFGAEEALLVAHLRTLSGVVVDIGAGPIRYVQELAQAQAAHTLRYVAVEPDLGALERTVTVLPDALCLQGIGEHLPIATQSADGVLMLRSFNHLNDVPQALREVARVLKPGGQFLACDNVAFGLCRSPAQLERAHAISVVETPFEHYRNADAPDAARALADAVPDGFRVDVLLGVGPGTSNQWFLRATRL